MGLEKIRNTKDARTNEQRHERQAFQVSRLIWVYENRDKTATHIAASLGISQRSAYRLLRTAEKLSRRGGLRPSVASVHESNRPQ